MSQDVLKDYEKSMIVNKSLLNIAITKNLWPNGDEIYFIQKIKVFFIYHLKYFAQMWFLRKALMGLFLILGFVLERIPGNQK